VPNSFLSDVNRQSDSHSEPFLAQAKLGFSLAVERANNAPGLRLYLKNAFINVLDIWFGLIPGVIVVGLFGLVIAEYTPIVTIISYPLVPLLELMKLPEASAAAPAFLVGFADMFLPAALGKEIDSEFTRFVVAGVSVSQLVYMSEVGILILKSPIPLSLTNMVIIFFQRTAIALPLFVIVGHFLWPGSLSTWPNS
jgi:nucleoside recognition membrane protein YjiH